MIAIWYLTLSVRFSLTNVCVCVGWPSLLNGEAMMKIWQIIESNVNAAGL